MSLQKSRCIKKCIKLITQPFGKSILKTMKSFPGELFKNIYQFPSLHLKPTCRLVNVSKQ